MNYERDSNYIKAQHNIMLASRYFQGKPQPERLGIFSVGAAAQSERQEYGAKRQ